jgi:Domain of unknown function (DUF3854)
MGATTLTTVDVAMFLRLGVGLELLEHARIERVNDAEARERYGIRGNGDMAGIVFPYFSPLDEKGNRWTARLRRDTPDIEDGKPKRKYISAYGDRKHLYFPPGAAQIVHDMCVPVILVEAEKSVLAERQQQRILPIALGGCFGWKGRIGKKDDASGEHVDEYGPLPDLQVCGTGRRVYVLLDANCGANSIVQQARRELVRQLRKQGADVRVLDLPEADGVNGPHCYGSGVRKSAKIAIVETP